MQLILEQKTDTRCMWCGKTNVELHHQYILPLCDCCVDEFKSR